MAKSIKIFFIILITIFIGIQFFPSAISADKPVDKVITGMPEEVNFILQKSCYNCHSNNNNLQWFEKIAPVSWFVTNHIDRAFQMSCSPKNALKVGRVLKCQLLNLKYS